MNRHARASQALRAVTATGLVALLVACGSTAPPRYHTLMPAPGSAIPRSTPVGPLAWEVLPVAIPAQVDQPQWVVRTADGSLAMLEQERWIAPLGEEIRAAVSEGLVQLVGTPAPMATTSPGQRWRVRIDVQRFDSAPGSQARLEATWTLRSDADGAVTLSCHGEFVQPLSSVGYPALAQAHQQGVARLAGAIGAALKAMSSGQPASCAG